MLVLLTTDNHIDSSEAHANQVQALVEDALSQFGKRITRVEIHLSDENGRDKGGEGDKRCAIEARLAGLKPIAVTHHASITDHAIDGALEKLQSVLTRTVERLDEHKGRTSFAGDQSL